MSNSQPSTTAIIPEAVRLERVRQAKGYGDSLWNFWKELTRRPPAGDFTAGEHHTDPESGTYKISYEAVRNYHYDRPAPGHYYAQVAAVFDVRLDWLLGGEPGMTVLEDAAKRTGLDIADGVLFSPSWSDEKRKAAMLHHWFRRVPAHHFWAPLPHPETTEMVATFLSTLLLRKGLAAAEAALVLGEDRPATEDDVARFYSERVAAPLQRFGDAPYAHKLAAFHNWMATLWLHEFGEDRWG